MALNNDINYARELALVKAVEFVNSNSLGGTSEYVLKVAEGFYKFLTSE